MSDQSPQWFILNDKNEQEGPISESTLGQLFSIGSVKPSTPVWTQALADWSTYQSEFPSSHSSETRRTILESPTIKTAHQSRPNSEAANRFFGGIHRPWRRCLARFVDVNLFGNIILLCCLFVLNRTFPSISGTISSYLLNPITSGVILLLAWLPAEWLFISLIGFTPGKWLFGITILSASGNKLTLRDSFKRYISMMIQGVGLCIPLVAFFTAIYSYGQLTSKGSTAWDRAADCRVLHKEPLSWRYFASSIGVIATFMFVIILRTAAKQ